jgi:DNA polymerase
VTSLKALRTEAASCTRCDLYKHATQTVFGEGPAHTPLMLMGETPGDKEDKAGHVFVGPAGHLLDEALADAGIDRTGVYLTNAVKHFKWEPARGGKVRLHKTPNRTEQRACEVWWQAELDTVKPKVLGLMGSVAAKAVLGPSFLVTKQRGRWIELPSGVSAIATVHPSSILRAQDNRAKEYAAFVKDLTTMTERL